MVSLDALLLVLSRPPLPRPEPPPAAARAATARASALPTAASVPADAGSPVRTWRAGERLTATVLGRTGPGEVLLRIDGQRVPVQTSVPIETGDELGVRVERAANPVVLKVLEHRGRAALQVANDALRAALPRQQPIGAALATARARLPSLPAESRGDAIRQGIESIVERAVQPARGVEPRALRAAVERSGLFMEARIVAGAAARAGPFIAEGDVKATLLRLRAAAQSLAAAARSDPGAAPIRAGGAPGAGLARGSATGSPPNPGTGAVTGRAPAPGAGASSVVAPSGAGSSLADPAAPVGASRDPAPAGAQVAPIGRDAGPASRQAASAHAEGAARENTARDLAGALDAGVRRIETQQLLSARAADQGAPAWHVDLPVRDREGLDTVRMRIAAEGGRDADPAERTWSVELSLDPQGLGPTHARVSLAGGRVSVLISAEDGCAAARLDAGSAALVERLEGAGLAVAAVRCRQGGAPADAAPAGDPPGLLGAWA